MKRFLALILTFVLLVALFPAKLVARAETVTTKPFYYVNWDRSFEAGEYDYVYAMPYTWINTGELKDDVEQINIGVYFNGYSTSNVEAAAAELYDEFKNYPVGARYLNLAAMGGVFNRFVDAAVDMEKGVELVRDWVIRFLDEYKSLGGELDGIAIDLEYNYAYNYYIESYHYNNSTESKRNRNIYNDIVANKVYQERIRPKLVEYEKQGLWQFYKNPDVSKYPYRSEIWTMYRYDSYGGNATCRGTWNWVISELLTEYINEAVTEPLLERYPNAILSDYSRTDSYSWYKTMSNSGESTGTGVRVGNSSNGVYYGGQFSEYYWASYYGSKTRLQYLKPVSSNEAVFDPTDKFTRALFDVNNQKRVLSSTIDRMGAEDAKVNVWMPFFYYANMEKSYGWNPYFAEVFYHMGMTDPEPYFGYTIKSEVESRMDWKNDADAGDFYYALQVNDELLKELTRVAGASDRKPIVTPIDWNSGYMLSGMYAGGRNIWRITPDTTKVSVEAFKVKDKAPTFTVNGVTVTFPQGRIISDSKISKIGTCGYWVETPANVTPVVTTSANRYAEHPSFYEDFSNYKTGAFTASASSMLKTTSGRPDTYWAATGNAEIKANGSNQYIALSGTSKLTNSKIVQHITAGDSYAKQQAWEVTVTLPDGNYGTVTLLDTGENDGGIKLSGGKVYYDKSGSYQELSGVTLAAGTYTFKREVDFRTEGAYKCSYAVYDASGNRLGGIDGVAIAIAKTPVTTLEFTTTDATAAVQIDDYKLYPTGFSTSLDLYTEDRGRKITDITVARTEDTGYRFAWMNASNQYKVARIYDVKTGKILKKIDMAPGMDGVASGLLQAEAGKSHQIAVDIKDETAPTAPNYDNGNFSWTAVSESIGLATGPKPAGGDTGNGGDTGDGNTGNTTPEVPGGNTTPENPGSGEEGGNIYDEGIVGGNPEYPSDKEPTATEPTATEPALDDDTAEPDIQKKGNGKMIILIVVLSIVVLAGAGVAVYIFVIKPKMAKPAEQSSEISEE